MCALTVSAMRHAHNTRTLSAHTAVYDARHAQVISIIHVDREGIVLHCYSRMDCLILYMIKEQVKDIVKIYIIYIYFLSYGTNQPIK